MQNIIERKVSVLKRSFQISRGKMYALLTSMLCTLITVNLFFLFHSIYLHGELSITKKNIKLPVNDNFCCLNAILVISN